MFMFHLIFLSPHFIVRTSLLFPAVHSPSHSFYLSQSISFIFTLFGCLHITWSFNHIVSFTFRPIFSLGISNLRVSLDKFLILDRYSLLEAELRWFYCSLSSLYIGGGNIAVGGCLGLLAALLKYRRWCFVPWCFGMGGFCQGICYRDWRGWGPNLYALWKLRGVRAGVSWLS